MALPVAARFCEIVVEHQTKSEERLQGHVERKGWCLVYALKLCLMKGHENPYSMAWIRELFEAFSLPSILEHRMIHGILDSEAIFYYYLYRIYNRTTAVLTGG